MLETMVKDMRYIVLDMEWNQPRHFSVAIKNPVHLKGEIIQIGAVKLDENFRTLDTFNVMICPKYYTKMHSKVAELTMISNQDLKKGIPFEKAFESFSKWCGKEFCILTWGWDDIPMLEDNLTIYNIDKSWIPDTYNIQPIFDAQITKTGKQCALSTAMELVGEPPFEAHDALNDAFSTACICRHLNMEAGLKNYVQCKRRLMPDSFNSPNKYKFCKDAKNDKKLSVFKCHDCEECVEITKWLAQKPDRYLAVGKCVCGQEYFIKLRFRKNEDKTYRANRTVYIMDGERREYYNKKLAEKEESRRKRLEKIMVN